MTPDKVSPPNDERRASYERFDVFSFFRSVTKFPPSGLFWALNLHLGYII